jgi:hypothetical protein
VVGVLYGCQNLVSFLDGPLFQLPLQKPAEKISDADFEEANSFLQRQPGLPEKYVLWSMRYVVGQSGLWRDKLYVDLRDKNDPATKRGLVLTLLRIDGKWTIESSRRSFDGVILFHPETTLDDAAEVLATVRKSPDINWSYFLSSKDGRDRYGDLVWEIKRDFLILAVYVCGKDDAHFGLPRCLHAAGDFLVHTVDRRWYGQVAQFVFVRRLGQSFEVIGVFDASW